MDEVYERQRKRDSVLEKFAGKIPDRQSTDLVRDAYEEARPRSREDLMLDVRFSDGSRCALSYGYLVKIEYEPSDHLKLIFGLDTVLVEGRRLLPLYELVRQHRAKYVQEGTIAEDGLKPEDAPHIDKIQLERKEEEV